MPRTAVRVVCGFEEVIATLLPTSAFVSVDLPAFGRPTKEAKPLRNSGTPGLCHPVGVEDPLAVANGSCDGEGAGELGGADESSPLGDGVGVSVGVGLSVGASLGDVEADGDDAPELSAPLGLAEPGPPEGTPAPPGPEEPLGDAPGEEPALDDAVGAVGDVDADPVAEPVGEPLRDPLVEPLGEPLGDPLGEPWPGPCEGAAGSGNWTGGCRCAH